MTLLATGLTNQLVADLMRIESLRVYAGGVRPAAAGAATAAPVEFRVEGSVQRDTAAIRVAARLVDVASGEVQWSETVDRPADMASELAVQDELRSQRRRAPGAARRGHRYRRRAPHGQPAGDHVRVRPRATHLALPPQGGHARQG